MKEKYIIIVEYIETVAIGESLYELISSIGKTEPLTPHAFLLSCSQSSVFIRDAIKNSPYEINSIFVIKVESSAAWKNVIANNEDIKELLHE